ncbi:flavin reductase [Micromonospora zingiberis]|uniref:Flavin reductase n=1 Tax=Micromonospora zingiberis TaxID=2053011 RepID=A0A4R0GK90_9ACTN|nr:flavin reductase [Micromonospora zingiberis]TCB97994.1 flavin reductase [Micromonospora zingiberis]
MSAHLRDHVPSRPTWRCRACGAAWPCSPAKLRLLAEHRGNLPGLMVYLARLYEEAGVHLGDIPATSLHSRFIGWARAIAPIEGPRSPGS